MLLLGFVWVFVRQELKDEFDAEPAANFHNSFESKSAHDTSFSSPESITKMRPPLAFCAICTSFQQLLRGLSCHASCPLCFVVVLCDYVMWHGMVWWWLNW